LCFGRLQTEGIPVDIYTEGIAPLENLCPIRIKHGQEMYSKVNLHLFFRFLKIIAFKKVQDIKYGLGGSGFVSVHL
jgi:hypothetical protein